MSKHTPGPWRLKGWSLAAGPEKILPYVKIVSPWHEDAWEGDAEAQANMRLIAAAPELLAELVKLAEYAERLGARPLSARAAIAKATGESE